MHEFGSGQNFDSPFRHLPVGAGISEATLTYKETQFSLGVADIKEHNIPAPPNDRDQADEELSCGELGAISFHDP